MPPRQPPSTQLAGPARGRSQQFARFILVVSALLLPTLSLLPFGALYLWQNGLVLHWAIGALTVVAAASGLEFIWLNRGDKGSGAPSAAGPLLDAPPQSWSSVEISAWRDVEVVARSIDLAKLESLSGFLDLGNRTVTAVATRMHSDRADPVWQFTLPEALALLERVSNRLGGMVRSHVPFANLLTLAQLRTAYRWRSSIDFAERLYDVWRVARLANPATAATNEARDRLTRAMLSWGRDQVTRRIAEMYVEEVGRAAIDLYGGRLRVGATAIDGLSGDNSALYDLIARVPLRVGVAGGSEVLRRRLTEVMPALPSLLYDTNSAAQVLPTLQIVVVDESGTDTWTNAARDTIGQLDMLVAVTSSRCAGDCWRRRFEAIRDMRRAPSGPKSLVVVAAREAGSGNQPGISLGGTFPDETATILADAAVVIGQRAAPDDAVVAIAQDSSELRHLMRDAIAAVRELRAERIVAGGRRAPSVMSAVRGAFAACARAVRAVAGRSSRPAP